MRKTVLIGASGLLAYAAYMLYQQRLQADSQAIEDTSSDSGSSDLLTTADGVLTDAAQTAAEFVDSWTGGYLKISAMAKVPKDLIGHPNVQAILRVIRAGEGTSDPDGYRRLFGGELFGSFADHPRKTIKRSGYTSTAAGAYQALSSTWDETARLMGLTDFSPRNQDLFALGRIAARGALDDVLSGKFDSAIKKISREWASMPGSPYGQPTISLQRARQLYADAGGGSVYA